MKCSILKLSHLLGKKWSIPLIEEMALNRFSGFNEFGRKAKRITPKVLSDRLKELEKANLIEKKTVRNMTNYGLTKSGLEMHKIVMKIKNWNIKYNNLPKTCLSTPCTECKMRVFP